MAKTQAKTLVKVIGEDVKDAVMTASKSLASASEAFGFGNIPESIGERGGFFNPTLSQYVKGLVLKFDPDASVITEVKVGSSSRTALCITVPAGMADENGGHVLDRAFNAYLSTFRKQIQVTDEVGDPVLDETKTPITVGGIGNPVWEAARSTSNELDLLNYLKGKTLKVIDIKRDFGPSVFVEQADGSRKATSHKITSLPLFEEVND